MEFTHFALMQDGGSIENFTTLEDAVLAAKRHAAETGSPVTIRARNDGCLVQEAVFNPDGTNERIWNIDGGTPLVPTAGLVYTNRGGGRYLCLSAGTGSCPTYYNAAGCASGASGVFRNVASGWTFTAKGIIQYVDGTVEWDHSTGGRFAEKEDEWP